MFPYSEETFTADEETVLRRYFTNLDLPVFALVNLPEVVKGALFARYSRSPKNLRRLFLDEFVGDLDVSGDASVDATVGLARAEQLYERVFVEYGDDSVAQLGGVHLACEQASNVLSKVLEWGRLMAYLEQSTRYIAYNQRLDNGQYRYYRPPEILESSHGARYVGEMDRVFDTYGEMLPVMQAWVADRFPQRAGDSDFVYRQATRAKSLDALRGLLPASSLSNIGIYGTGQAYEQLLLRMRAHPLPEARSYADLMLTELRKVIPSFLQRVDVADRGGEWSAYLASTREQTRRVVATFWPDLAETFPVGPSAAPDPDGDDEEVVLLDFDPDGEEKVLVAACFSQLACSEREAARRVRLLGHDDRVALLRAYVGERRNRRHRPGRGFERTDYRFELVTDYGAFRDLQRHRMLTVEWQRLGVSLGYDMPDLVAEAGLGERYDETISRAEELYWSLLPAFPEQASYAAALAHRIRYILQLNAREAMHLIELRSGTQGHPAYRRVAQQMHRAIAEVAGHRALAEAMSFVDHGATDLERLESERRAERRRSEKSATH
ncbi:MAG TPA: FAD-dependent thymidylate synthase [Acidimicrobiales bacterium]|jgi:thymidylate synthase ThyX|nr:FAD-dependent thymidylate synthase [Acidimicrobiales bacterium]